MQHSTTVKAMAPVVPLPALLHQAAATWPERTAASFPDTELSYAQLWGEACHIGNTLVRAGVRPGDHIGLLMPNCARMLASLFGVSLAGAVPVPLNTRYRSDELPYVIEHADMTGIITMAEVSQNNAGELVDYLQRIEDALPALKTQSAGKRLAVAAAPRLGFVAAYGATQRAWVTPWQEGSAEETPELRAQREAVSLDDIAVLLYTSGTTARPKGVLQTHRAIVTTCTLGGARMDFGAGDVVWSPSPLCHIAAYVAIIGCAAVGAELLTSPYFEPEVVLDQLIRRRATIAFANFPAFFFALGNLMQSRGLDVPSLKLLTTAAAPAEIERIRKLFPGATQVSVTGSTETAGCMCINDKGDPPEKRAETAGRPLDGIKLSIRDVDTLEEVPSGTSGELWVSGVCTLKAYYKDPKPALTGEPDPGWFRTADLFTLDEAGRLAFRGRIKDMLKVGGENVSAAEIENYLLAMPAIAVVQVVSAPDDNLGEVPAAFIERKAGASLTEEEVIAFCRAGVARFKVPRIVRFVTEWPMSSTKIQKERLRAILRESQTQA